MPKIKETYVAIVAATDDELQRGRIKVICPELTGVEDMMIEEWVEPLSDWGWFYVPDIGELVEVEAVVHDDYSESYLQAFLEYPDLRWRGKEGRQNPPTPAKKKTQNLVLRTSCSPARTTANDAVSTHQPDIA